jgi:hypothetical protein
MLTDKLTDAVWYTHAGGTASIGGVAYTEAEMAQVSGDELTMQVAGSADPTGKGYPCNMWYTSRPIYSKTGCTLKYDLQLGPTALTAMNGMETDGMYAMTCADGQVRLFNLSAQWLPGTGWMVVNAQGEWVAVGYNPNYQPGTKYAVKIRHSWDLVKNTFSVLSFDGFLVPAPLQNVPAKESNWQAGFVNVQVQPSSKPAGLPWSSRVSKIELKWA